MSSILFVCSPYACLCPVLCYFFFLITKFNKVIKKSIHCFNFNLTNFAGIKMFHQRIRFTELNLLEQSHLSQIWSYGFYPRNNRAYQRPAQASSSERVVRERGEREPIRLQLRLQSEITCKKLLILTNLYFSNNFFYI